MGGTNDCNFSVDFGTSDSDDINTLYGALKKLCKGLKDKYPTNISSFLSLLIIRQNIHITPVIQLWMFLVL